MSLPTFKSDRKTLERGNASPREKLERLQAFLDEPDAPTPLTPMGMARELVEKWHAEHFGIKIKAWKLELLASRIASLVVANTLEALRGFEDYNGKHQIACVEIERLNDVLRRHGFRPCDIPACNCGSWHQTVKGPG